MVDSHENSRRWDELGVPTAQVDFVLDVLLPHLRATLPVDSRGEATFVSGQSFGGLAALWTVALSEGQVGRALAQSPSLWRFDLTDPLLGEPRWRSLRVRSGAFEGAMLDDARALATRLGADPRLADRHLDVSGVEGGHDWAWWRQDLLAALEEVSPPTPTDALPSGANHTETGATPRPIGGHDVPR
jgi:Enterochelin esterase and related enzymes